MNKAKEKLIYSLLKKYKKHVKNAIHEKGNMKKATVDEFNEINHTIKEMISEEE